METLVTGVPSTKLLLVPVLHLVSSSAVQHSSQLWSSSVSHSQLLASLQLLQILQIFLIWWDPLRQPWPLHKVWISLWWAPMLWASVYPCQGHRYAAFCTVAKWGYSVFCLSLITMLKLDPFHSWNPYLVTQMLWPALHQNILSENDKMSCKQKVLEVLERPLFISWSSLRWSPLFYEVLLLCWGRRGWWHFKP